MIFAPWQRWCKTRRQQRYALPDDLWHNAISAVAFISAWPPPVIDRLRNITTRFLGEKSIIGAQGFKVTPWHRVVVALQASIPILYKDIGHYDSFATVILYDAAFINASEWEDENGVIHKSDEATLGETMPGGPVVLAWHDHDDYSEDEPVTNVVIHEFVHKLDMKNGEANGCPPLPACIKLSEWQATMQRAFTDFRVRVEREDENYLQIDPYAAEDLAEFFAVLSEIYFVTPALLRDLYPEVYELFKHYYETDYRSQRTDYRTTNEH